MDKVKITRITLIFELFITICIMGAIVFGVVQNVEKESEQYATDIALDYSSMIDDYKTQFNMIKIQVEEKIKQNLTFDEMNKWLQSKEEDFKKVIGNETYDGFAMTYRGGYARSWNYGNYENYDATTRPWYKEAVKANGELCVVAPYVTFLNETYYTGENSILMTIAQKYNNEIVFDYDIKIKNIKNMLENHKTQYDKSTVLIFDDEGYILSSSEPSLYSHNINKSDKVVSKSFKESVKKAGKVKDVCRITNFEDTVSLSFYRKYDDGNRLVVSIPLVQIFLRDFLSVSLLTVVLLFLEIYIYVKTRRNQKEFDVRDKKMFNITSLAFSRQYDIDLDTMKCSYRIDKNTEKTIDYNMAYLRNYNMIAGFSQKKEFEDFLSPEVLKDKKPNYDLIESKQFTLNSNGDDDLIIKFSLIVSFIDKKRIATILINDVTVDENHRINTLQTIADHYEVAYFVNIDTKKYSLIKVDDLYNEFSQESDDKTIDTDEMHKIFADEFIKPEYRNGYVQSVSFDNIVKKLAETESFTNTVQLMNGHWHTTKIMRSVDFETSHDFVFCVENVDEQMKQQEELSNALKNANVATQAKTDFLSRMSHDMRTPMNGIIGMTEIASQINTDEKVGECLEIINSSSGFLLGLINDVLDISKIESGEMHLHEAPLELKEFDTMVNSVIVPLMKEKNIDFEYKMNCGMNVACVDAVRFGQIFFNLLSNSAKYTAEGGKVIFSAEKLDETENTELVRFIVKDNGVGMNEEFLSHAFEPFEQDDLSNSKLQRQGTGLGLPIAKQITELMGGTISVKSEEGVGTEFKVDLPLKKAKKAEGNSNSKDLDLHVLNGKKILLAEDNNINMLVATKLLESKGMSTVHARNGKEAIDLFENSTDDEFDAILMDIRMPVLSGLDATKQIRKSEHKNAKSIPIIAMTANAFEDDVKKSIEAGMNDHLAKPFEPKKLYTTIAKFLQK